MGHGHTSQRIEDRLNVSRLTYHARYQNRCTVLEMSLCAWHTSFCGDATPTDCFGNCVRPMRFLMRTIIAIGCVLTSILSMTGPNSSFAEEEVVAFAVVSEQPKDRMRIAAKVAIEGTRSEEHTSELQSRRDLVCRLLLEKKKKK